MLFGALLFLGIIIFLLFKKRFAVLPFISWGLFALLAGISVMPADPVDIMIFGFLLLLLIFLICVAAIIIQLVNIYGSKKQRPSFQKILGSIFIRALPGLLGLVILFNIPALSGVSSQFRFRIPDAHCKNVLPGYSGIQNFSQGLAIIKNEKDFNDLGYINRAGAIVFHGEFNYIDSFSQDLAVVQRFQKKFKEYRFGYINPDGTIAIDFLFNDAKAFSEGLAAVKVKGKYGYIDKTGAFAIEPQFDDAFPFSQGRAKVVVKGLCGFIDTTGKTIVEPRFYKAGSFSDGLAFVGDKTKCGYIDVSGQIVINPAYDDARAFSEGFAPVKIGKKWKYINKDGAYLSNNEFDEALPFSEGLACVGVIKTNFYDKQFGGYSGIHIAYGFIDASGEYVIQPKFLLAESFHDGLSRVNIPAGDWFGEIEDYIFIDKQERKVSKRFEFAKSFKDGLALVMAKDHTLGFIDTTGRFVIRFDTKNLFFPREVIPARWTRYGFIDATGTSVIPPSYFYARSFSDDLAYVDARKRGFIDAKGEKVVKVSSNTLVGDFSQGLAAASVYDSKIKKSLYGYIDKTGNFVIKPQFYGAKKFAGDVAAVKFTDNYSNSWGYIDRNGAIVIEAKYYAAGPFYRGLALVEYIKQRGEGHGGEIHYGFIDTTGTMKIDVDTAGFNIFPSSSFSGSDDEDFIEARGGHNVSFYSFIEPVIAAVSKKPPFKWGYVDSSGGFAIEPKYDEARPFSQGLAAVKVNQQWGYIDMTGKLAIEPRYDDAEPFSDGRALVKENGKYGYLDTSGAVIIEPQFFEKAYSFVDGLALIKMNNKYGFIDARGNFVVPPQYDDARSFSQGLALIGIADFKAEK